MSEFEKVGESISDYEAIINVLSCIQRRSFELEKEVNKHHHAFLRFAVHVEGKLRELELVKKKTDEDLLKEQADSSVKSMKDALVKIEAELKASITQCLWDFTNKYAAPDAHETYSYCLPIMRRVLTESLEEVRRQSGDFTTSPFSGE